MFDLYFWCVYVCFLDFIKVWKSSMMPERSLRKYSNELVFPGWKFPRNAVPTSLEHFPKKQKKKWLAPSTFRQEYGAYVLGFRLLGKAAGEYLFCSYTHRFMGVWRVGYQRDNRVDQVRRFCCEVNPMIGWVMCWLRKSTIRGEKRTIEVKFLLLLAEIRHVSLWQIFGNRVMFQPKLF